MSASIDFWIDSVRRESNSAIVVNMGADRYVLADGQELFMISQTRDKINPDLLTTGSLMKAIFRLAVAPTQSDPFVSLS